MQPEFGAASKHRSASRSNCEDFNSSTQARLVYANDGFQGLKVNASDILGLTGLRLGSWESVRKKPAHCKALQE